MKNSSKYILGALLVIGGITVLFGNLRIFNMSWLMRLSWPMIFIVIAAFFFLGYLAKRPYGAGLLVPAGILGTLGVTFLVGEAFSYKLVWPGFIAAPAVGLLLLYIFAERRYSGLLVPVGILMTVASVFFIAQIFGFNEIIAPGMVLAPAVGLFLLYLAGEHNNGLLVPVFILTAIAVILFMLIAMDRFAYLFKYIIGGALIIGGLSTILKQPKKKDSYYQDDYSEKPRF
jgi:hypothetical protein